MSIFKKKTKEEPSVEEKIDAGVESDASSHEDERAESVPYIKCDSLVRIFKSEGIEVMALQGLDLEIQRGELTAIIGKSGSGKSTMTELILRSLVRRSWPSLEMITSVLCGRRMQITF